MSSQPAVQQTQTQSTNKPLNQQMPTWLDIWGGAQHALNQPMPQNFYAGPNQTQKQAVNMLRNVAPSLNDNAGAISNMAQKIASGYFLNPMNDPTFKGAANAAIRPITTQLRQSILPQIMDRSTMIGGSGAGPAAYGGARQDLQQERALSDWETASGDITGELAHKSRLAGMGLIPSAAPMAAAANQLRLAPAQALSAAGQQLQSWEQGGIDEQIKKYLFGFTGPQMAANIMQTGGFGQQSGLTTQTGPEPNMATQWLQGLTGGASGLASLFGQQGAFPGGLMSLFSGLGLSDRRAKENIEQIGTSFSGTPIYRFNYIGDPVVHLGMMADEVPSEAVHEVDGLSYVDYVAATEKDVQNG